MEMIKNFFKKVFLVIGIIILLFLAITPYTVFDNVKYNYSQLLQTVNKIYPTISEDYIKSIKVETSKKSDKPIDKDFADVENFKKITVEDLTKAMDTVSNIEEPGKIEVQSE